MKSELRSIKKAPFIKRLIATLMDGAVTLFVFFALYLFVFTPIANAAFGYKTLQEDKRSLQLESHLYVDEDESDDKENYVLLIESSNTDIDFYKERLNYYYLTFKTTKAPDCNEKHVYEENESEKLPSEYYTEDWFNSHINNIDNIDSIKNASKDALIDFSAYVKPYSSKIKLIGYFIFICPYILSFGGFYILVPLLYKNGETFGKKTMGLSLISNDEYSVKKRQVILRQLFIFVYVGLFSFYATVSLASLGMLGLGIFIYFLVAFIVKDNRSFADLLAYTRIIDGKNSVWFVSQAEEENKEKIVEENLAKYNKVDELDPHILQVGTEIVNEEAKKEFEDSKKTKNK